MNTDTPERDTLAFLEALAGEYAGESPTRRSRPRAGGDPAQELVAAFALELGALVA